MLNQWLLIGLAGGAGALARYELTALTQRWLGTAFPWGTALVNVLGSLLFGLVWAIAEDRVQWSLETRTIILTGFMGSFTTFSTFVFETGNLWQSGQWILGIANLLLHILLGLLFLFVGLAVGKAL